MKKLRNPFDKSPAYNCFGCSGKNELGLRLEFFEDGDEIVSTWNPESHFQGYTNMLHGGIQSTLMDEIASWVVFVKLKSGGVTSRLTTRFRRPVLMDQGAIKLRAKLLEQKRNIAVIDVKLLNSKGELCSESVAEYFILTDEQANLKAGYPGVNEFYEK